jgi:two-component system, chemotaxis family, sensor kinase CheA
LSDDFNFSTGMPSDEMAQYVQMFVDETSEQLDDLVEVLLVLETKPDSSTHLNESFRLIHSIKGAAAMMGLDSITLLTHHLENHFEHLRGGIETLDKSMMNLILKCVDFLRDAVDLLREGKPLSSAPELIELLSRSVAEIRAASEDAPVHASSGSASEVHETTMASSPVATQSEMRDDVFIEKRIIVYLDQSIELPELKAELIIARLSDLAVISRTSPDIEELGSLAALRTLQVWLETTKSDNELRSAADIVGVEMIEIDTVGSDTVNQEAIVKLSVLEQAKPNQQREQPSPEQPVSTDAVQLEVEPVEPHKEVAPERVAIAEPTTLSTISASPKDEPTHAPENQSKVVETLRVDIQRLDRLMNLTGELVVNRARFAQLAFQMTDTFKKSGLISQLRDLCEMLRETTANDSTTEDANSRVSDERLADIRSTVIALEEQLHTLERGRRSFMQLNEAIDQFSRVSDGLQRGVLDTRMVPIGPLFNRFKRTVRDISSELGKIVNFVIKGENTELDKRMIDELGDPLVHLVRNAIDHGLESQSVRRSRGKPDAGTLTLDAAHSGNHVLITISDDGAGINTERVKRRAIERRLISSIEADMMSDYEIAQFIWAPGFSTAEVVSDISGRGVGMDIVKTRIGELNGTIEVDSSLGKGTRFIIRLPLTLAIIRSLLFKLPQGTFAAPIENVREIVSVRDESIVSVHGRDSIEVRGEFIPLVRIDDVFDWHETRYTYASQDEHAPDSEGAMTSVLIITSGTKSMGLVVSALKGCQDIVVKSLDENFTHIRGLAGASILGDGSVCLLLDVVSCLELARQRLRDRPLRRPMAIL